MKTLEAIPSTLLVHVNGGDQLGSELTTALRLGMRNYADRAPVARDPRIHWDASLGACTDGMGIVNCPRRGR